MLRLDLSDYSDAYVDVKGKVDILVAALNENDKEKKLYKNNALFRVCILEINKMCRQSWYNHVDILSVGKY